MLKHVILGILSQQSSTGYEICRKIEDQLIGVWSASHPQIYPELRHMMEDGLITYELEIKGQALERKRYAITERGFVEFQEWLKSETATSMPVKDEFKVKLFFSSVIDGADARQQLEEQIQNHEEILGILRKRRSRTEDEGYVGTPEALYNELVLQGNIMQEQNYIEWLRLCRETLQQLG